MSSGIDAEDVAILCLLEADGELEVLAADVADMIDATERRAGASFGPKPGVLRQALAGLVLEAALARIGDLAAGGIDEALARVTLGDLLGPMLSQDRLWFTGAGSAHWVPASPAARATLSSRPRTEILLALAAARPPSPVVNATLARLGIDRSFIADLLESDREPDDEDLRRQAAYQDWYE